MSRTITYPPVSSGGGGGVTSFAHILKPTVDIPRFFSGQTPAAGELLLMPFDVPVACTLDGIAWETGSSSSGNYRIGIYGPATTLDQPNGLSLLYDSGTKACPATRTSTECTFSSATLAKGQYFVGIQFSAGTQTFAMGNEEFGLPPNYQAHIAATFGTLPNPIGTTLHDDISCPYMLMRVH